MADCEHNSAVPRFKLNGKLKLIFLLYFLRIGPGIIYINMSAIAREFVYNVDYLAIAYIGAILLERHSKNKDFTAFDWEIILSHQFNDTGCDIKSHVVIDPSS